MSDFCPNCLEQVRDDDRFCSTCGQTLDEHFDRSVSPESADGFLSTTSVEYLTDVVKDNTELGPSDPRYSLLHAEIWEAFIDFAVIGAVEQDIDLLEMVISQPEPDSDYWRNQQESVLLGFYSVLRLYDESLNTDMEGMLDRRVNELVDVLSKKVSVVFDQHRDERPE